MRKIICLFAAIFCASLFSCARKDKLPETVLEVKEHFGLETAEDYCHYGFCYFYGWDGFDVDYEKSLEFFKIAVKMGSGEAMWQLAEFYAGGYVYKQNYKKAAEWLKKSVDAGYTEALYRLGVLYEYGGHGLKADKKEADYWYERYKKEHKVKTPLDILIEEAEGGQKNAQFNLGCAYFDGPDAGKYKAEYDIQKALYWLEKAGEQNHDEALSLLGQIYLQKTWVPRDFTKAAEYLTKASDLGNAYARYKLAQMYENGTGIEANKEKAMELYQLAADGGVEEAADYLRFLKRR